MPSTPSGGEPETRAHRFRLPRRRFLAAGAALAASAALPIAANAAPASEFFDSSDAPSAASHPAESLLPDWPPPPPPSNIVVVPYRSQLDGSPQARANCGPASLAMLLGFFGDGTSIADLRYSVNRFMGVWWVDNGSTWEALASAASTRGYDVLDLTAGGAKYRTWTVADLAAKTRGGLPVMILVRYRALPGRQISRFYGDHYVVVVGVDDDGSIVFHDPAYLDASTGAYLRMTPQQLSNAWSTVACGIQYTGMAIRPRKK